MAPIDRYRNPSDLPARIPVFPLRGAILLPRATLPLNLFEPRYVAMIEDCIGSSRILGIIQPARTGPSSAGEPEESPLGKHVGLRRVGCAGRVTAYQEVPDGRIVITLTGVSRFTVISENPSAKPYRICEVSYEPFLNDFDRPEFGADVGTADRSGVNRTQLLAVLKRYLEANNFKADWRSIEQAPSEHLVNSLAIMSPYGPEEKQALLEAADVKTRADVLIALAEMELAAGDGGTGTTLQ
jgi:uncharacterized protein